MLALVLILSGVTAMQAEMPDPARIRRLVQQLDDDELVARQAAEQALIALGPAVLDVLPALAEPTAPELRERLGRIKQTLQRQRAEQFAEGTRVTLKGPIALGDAFREIKRQTGNAAFGYENRQQNVQVDWQGRLYWEAMDDLLDQAGLTIQPLGSHSDALDLVSRPDDQEPRRKRADYRGAFRLEPKFVRALSDLQQPSNSGLMLRAAVTWEPRIAPITFTLPLSTVEARDDRGRPVAVSRPATRLSFPVEYSVTEADFDLPLQLPARDAQSIASLRGTLQALVPGRVARFEFTDLSDGDRAPQRQADVTVALERVGRNDQLQELRVRVEFDDAGEALQSHRGWIYKNDVYLLGGDGQRVELAGLELKSQAANSFGIAYYFALDDELDSYRFVYETPAMIVRLNIPFELNDIELP